MGKIKLFVACHDDVVIPKSDLLFPIQVGASLSDIHYDGMLHDDTGDNISAKNRMYCELTAQYWVWKNYLSDVDYCGFFHYRRFLNFKNDLPVDSYDNIIFDEELSRKTIQDLGITDLDEDFFSKYDVITTRGRHLPDNQTIYEQYSNSESHCKIDLDNAIITLKELYPDYADSADWYMKSNVAYECNMFVMKSEIFREYASWLFSILFKTETLINTSSYDVQMIRVMGFLGERLFGIWYVHNKGRFRCLELQKTLFRKTTLKIRTAKENEKDVMITLMLNSFTLVTVVSIMKSIKQNRKYRFFIFYKNADEYNINALKRLTSSDDRCSIEFICIEKGLSKYQEKLRISGHITIDTYYRFFIFDYFKNVDKILYLDTDLIVKHDIAELYDYDVTDYYLAAARDVDMIGVARISEERKQYVLNTVGLNKIEDYFQAGVILFNVKKITEKYETEDFFKIAISKDWIFMDQDVMNNMLSGHIFYIGQDWNCVSDCPNKEYNSRLNIIKKIPYEIYDDYINSRSDPKIIHYAGWQKPWDTPDMDFGFEYWNIARESDNYEIILKKYYISHFLGKKPDSKGKSSVVKKFIVSVKKNGFAKTIKKCCTYLQNKRK